jgi:hypothetical protein
MTDRWRQFVQQVAKLRLGSFWGAVICWIIYETSDRTNLLLDKLWSNETEYGFCQ